MNSNISLSAGTAPSGPRQREVRHQQQYLVTDYISSTVTGSSLLWSVPREKLTEFHQQGERTHWTQTTAGPHWTDSEGFYGLTSVHNSVPPLQDHLHRNRSETPDQNQMKGSGGLLDPVGLVLQDFYSSTVHTGITL